MTFEEEFPSLMKYTGGMSNEGVLREGVFTPKLIQEHCLDKQRVKDTINKAIQYANSLKNDPAYELSLRDKGFDPLVVRQGALLQSMTVASCLELVKRELGL